MTRTKWTRLLELRGSVAFAETILPPDTRVVNYLLDYAQPDAIQWLLDNGFIKKNKDASAFAILTLARTGNLDLMKQVDKLHSRKRLNKDWIDKWDWAMDSASERGDLAMVKWMAEDRAGRAVLARIKDDSVFNICKILDSAAKAGHIDVLQYLFEHGWPDEDADTLLNAAAGGQLDCVKWLLDNAPPYSQDNNADGAVVSAARNGHLVMLQFFHELYLNESAQPKHVNGEPSSKRRRTGQAVDWWARAEKAMEEAAAKGHLEVARWLHANHFEGCSKFAMDKPAQNDHLEVLKWQHANTDAGCTTSAMTNAAFNGHLEVCKWLHANRSEGCTASAVKFAIGNGHLHVAYWLRLRYPQFIPEHNRLWKYPLNTFDMLIFLQDHYPTLLTLEFGRGTKSDLRYENARGGDHLIAQWPDPKYPGHPTERHQANHDLKRSAS